MIQWSNCKKQPLAWFLNESVTMNESIKWMDQDSDLLPSTGGFNFIFKV